MGAKIAQSVALGVGASGAMVDVTAYLKLDAGIKRTWGKETDFDDTRPDERSFSLENGDGRFTPDNASSALVTKLTEGTAVCWQSGTRLLAGTVQSVEPDFPGDNANWSVVRVTCDDMLGTAARTDMDDTLVLSMINAAGKLLYWPLNEDAGAGQALEVSGQPSLTVITGAEIGVTFGTPGVPQQAETAATFTGSGTSTRYLQSSGTFDAIDYAASAAGAWGFWFQPLAAADAGTWFRFEVMLDTDTVKTFGFYAVANVLSPQVAGATFGTGTTLEAGRWYYLAVEVTTTATQNRATCYVDGVSVGAGLFTPAVVGTTKALRSPQFVRFGQADVASGATSFRVQHLSHTVSRPLQNNLTTLTETGRFLAIVDAIPGVTAATPTTLSAAPIAVDDPDGSGLAALNDVARTEGGYVYTATTGTITAPVQTVIMRPRDRPTAVAAIFDIDADVQGAPELVRDLTNLVQAVKVEGPAQTVRVADSSLSSRTSNTASESVLLAGAPEMRSWGQDRMRRGALTSLHVVSFVVDGLVTSTDRTAALLALLPGDRIQLTGLPSTQLGSSTADGWLIGGEELHSTREHSFTLKIAVPLPADPVYDTDRYMAGEELTLNAGINAAVTSFVYATTGSEMDSTNVPYTILIDSEQMTVTAVNQGTNTATVTRAAGGTTAAAHSAGAFIDLATPDYYAF